MGRELRIEFGRGYREHRDDDKRREKNRYDDRKDYRDRDYGRYNRGTNILYTNKFYEACLL